MDDYYQVLRHTSLLEAVQSLEEVYSVAVVRNRGCRLDRVPPVLVGAEALVFCAWDGLMAKRAAENAA